MELVGWNDAQPEPLQELAERLRPLYEQLAQHRLYRSFASIEDLRVFLEAHVFAVWDFMSLLKVLQRGLTCVDVPWVPSTFPVSRRLINEIVLGEESDVYAGRPASHFEIYLMAMKACGASTVAIDALVAGVRRGEEIDGLLAAAPVEAREFVRTTFGFIKSGKLHAVAAAFTFGREDLIPDMFRSFIRDQNDAMEGRLEMLRWYMERHIEVDGDEHGPMALRMIAELCGNDAAKWQEASVAAEEALLARIALWDGVVEGIELRREE
ncbi:Protein of unknown function [Granulicella pectinivorans]|jgi:hypothetical protein|uniref:DUF3050 domain-containing protein n=1 Tax=Granulicella pectinivorans TaxID=474950 RepID=A0A1I6LRY5_9BACT|nr:DUF3050 domain-containing protein [Granulicella pectinivorans]SFS06247.1 Protein of unknown function [Granulicella pectinivorans]